MAIVSDMLSIYVGKKIKVLYDNRAVADTSYIGRIIYRDASC